MQPEAIQGLAGGVIAARAGGIPEATAPVRTGEGTDRNRHAVDECHRVGPFTANQLLPELVLERPQGGGLTDTGRPVNVRKRRKEMGVLSLNVLEDRLILGRAEELADDVHRHHFTIGEDGLRSALTEATSRQQRRNGFINQARGRYNNLIQVHGAPPSDSESPPSMVVPVDLVPNTCTSRYLI
jgi:hypothetical protein